MPISGLTIANLTSDTLLEGVLNIAGTNIGVTRAGLKFDPGRTWENIPFDGRNAPVYLADRPFHGTAKISGKLIEFGPSATGNQIVKLEPGSSQADSGSTPNTITTVTIKAGSALAVAADYLSNVYLVAERAIATGTGVKKYAGIKFAKGICTKWSLSTPSGTGETEIDFEIEARLDTSSGTIASAPYSILLWETQPSS